MASSTVSPAMKRRAKLVGDDMPYRDARRLSVGLWESAWNTARVEGTNQPSMRPPVRRGQKVIQRAGVIPQHVAIAHAEAPVLDDDDAARLEGPGRGIHRLGSAGDAEVRAGGVQRLQNRVSPIL